MPLTPYRGYLIGTKKTVLLQPPNGAAATVKSLIFLNVDTVVCTITLATTDGTTEVPYDKATDVDVNGRWALTPGEVIVIKPGDMLIAYLATAHTTNPPSWHLAAE